MHSFPHRVLWGINVTKPRPRHVLESNLAAVNSGANVLFCKLLDPAKSKDFGAIDNRNIAGTEHIYAASEISGMEISF